MDDGAKSKTGRKKQGLPSPNPRRAERLAVELRANLKKRKSAVQTREITRETGRTLPGPDGDGSGE